VNLDRICAESVSRDEESPDREGLTMWRRTPAAILLAALLAPGGAAPAAGESARRFTLSEEVIIARNDALTALLPIDPDGVRRILDALEAVKRAPDGGRTPPPQTFRDVLGGPGGETLRIDPARNPDLNQLLQRGSPEAAYDLFQILKRVGSGKAGIN
jgi:hypothetical protein